METLYRKVADLDLSIRTKNLLINAGIDTLQELTSYTKSDLMKFRNLGRRSLIELEDLMLKNNLSFRTVESIKSDNSHQIEKLEAEKAELLEALEMVHELVTDFTADSLMIIEAVSEKAIQKHKK